jgi:type VI secretion system protein ImpC
MAESVQHQLSRIRPPRVQITYDVHTGGAAEKVELPFVVGVMADLSGDRKVELPKMKKRKFVEIDRDNFNKVLTKIHPRLEYSVKNTSGLHSDFNGMKATLDFESMDDFKPENILQKESNEIGTLKERYSERARLNDFLTKLDGNDELNEILQGQLFIRSYKLTEEALLSLKKEGIPEEICTALASMQEEDLLEGEEAFWTKLLEKIEEEQKQAVEEYKNQIIKIASSSPSTFELSEASIEQLKKEAVPLQVINKLSALLNTSETTEATPAVPATPATTDADATVAETPAAPATPSTDATTADSDSSIKAEGEAKFWEILTGKLGEEKEGEIELELYKGVILKYAIVEPHVIQFHTENLTAIQGICGAWKDEDALTSPVKEMIEQGKMARAKIQQKGAHEMIGETVKQMLAGTMAPNPDIAEMVNLRIGTIDRQVSLELNEVLHHEKFQKLEASWKGLQNLVMNTETGSMLKIRLMNASKAEIEYDLDTAVEFDQSILFKKVYEEEYGTLGGHPYGLLIGDYAFGRNPRDVDTLTKISGVAAAAHAPFLAAADSSMFDLGSYEELGIPRDLKKSFESSELIPWNAFRKTEDSRYVALTLPRVLMRLPYSVANNPVQGMAFEEDVDGRNHSKYLWGNPAYSLGLRITTAFAKYKWCAAIRGVEGGGKVEGLPIHSFTTDEGDLSMKCPTEITITDRREKELSDLGFMSICYRKGEDYSVFIGGQTTNEPKKYQDDNANANARISAVLPYMLAASRFAHYFKVMIRDKVGSFQTADEIQKFLNGWLSEYILLKDDASQELKSEYPLREGRVDVVEVPGKPGVFTAIAYLRPHFQLEELTTSIRLVAELPEAG